MADSPRHGYCLRVAKEAALLGVEGRGCNTNHPKLDSALAAVGKLPKGSHWALNEVNEGLVHGPVFKEGVVEKSHYERHLDNWPWPVHGHRRTVMLHEEGKAIDRDMKESRS